MRRADYTNEFRYRGSYCPNILLRCIDPRFHAALEAALPQWLTQLSGSGAFASMALPGGAAAILDPAARPVVFRSLDLAIRALEANRLIIADHIDCRAHGGSDVHAGPWAEEQFHQEQLRKAREVIRETYPRLEVMLIYQDWESIREVN